MVEIHPMVQKMQTSSYEDADDEGIRTKCDVSPSPSVWGHNERPLSGAGFGVYTVPGKGKMPELCLVDWNKVYRLEIYVLTPAQVSLISIQYRSAQTPGLQHWHGLGEVESKSHIKLYMFSFQTDMLSAINYISLSIYKSLCS